MIKIIDCVITKINVMFNMSSRVIKFTILLCLVICITAQAQSDFDKKLSLQFNLGGRQPCLNDRNQPWAVSTAYSGTIGYGLTSETMLLAEIAYSQVYDDTLSGNVYKFGSGNAGMFWRIKSFKILSKHYFIGESRFIPYWSWGGGLSFWQKYSNITGKKLRVLNADGDSTDYGATEVLLTAALGYDWFLSKNLALNAAIDFNYLTNIGADFSTDAEENRSRAYFDFKVGITLFLNFKKSRSVISHDALYSQAQPTYEQSLTDFDLDGILNENDLCPDTPPEARAMVDEFGCPYDTDGDGLADYVDQCPYKFAEIRKDSTGCPEDKDRDFIGDDKDECPDTPLGYPVDHRGCPVLDSIFQKRVLHVHFSKSGKGVDFMTVRYLDSVAVNLKLFPDVRAVIRAYMDNNMELDESLEYTREEADKLMQYLILRRVSPSRVEAHGMGAVRFIDTNSTPEGRANNHRIEIEFEY